MGNGREMVRLLQIIEVLHYIVLRFGFMLFSTTYLSATFRLSSSVAFGATFPAGEGNATLITDTQIIPSRTLGEG